MTDYERLIPVLVKGGVRFIVVGGFAATLHGSVRLTVDLDIVYARDPENCERLARTLAPLHPYLRGAPPGLPFRWDVETLRNGLNFTLITDFGDLDVLGEVAGGESYETLIEESRPVQVFGVECACLNLEAVIRTKRAAGRRKDFDAIAELEALLEERKSQG